MSFTAIGILALAGLFLMIFLRVPVGIALGIGAATAIARFAGWPFVISPQTILVAVGVSGLIGVFFGFYPARQAARLDPIEALRRE